MLIPGAAPGEGEPVTPPGPPYSPGAVVHGWLLGSDGRWHGLRDTPQVHGGTATAADVVRVLALVALGFSGLSLLAVLAGAGDAFLTGLLLWLVVGLVLNLVSDQLRKGAERDALARNPLPAGYVSHRSGDVVDGMRLTTRGWQRARGSRRDG